MQRASLAGVVAVLALAGCGQLHHPASHPPSNSVEIPTSCWPGCSGGFAQTALIKGVLRGSAASRCLWLSPSLPKRVTERMSPADRRRALAVREPVLWPHGYRASFDPLELYDASGKRVAKGAETILAGGGLSNVNPSRRCMFGHRSVATIQSQIQVVATRPPGPQ
jgi:hypothetical protein